jgi:hypothetical protein
MPACRKKSNSEKIIGTWIGAYAEFGGYKGTNDTLIFKQDSIFIYKSKSVLLNQNTKYWIIGDTLKFPNGRESYIYFKGTDCLHWRITNMFDEVNYYFTKQR